MKNFKSRVGIYFVPRLFLRTNVIVLLDQSSNIMLVSDTRKTIGDFIQTQYRFGKSIDKRPITFKQLVNYGKMRRHSLNIRCVYKNVAATFTKKMFKNPMNTFAIILCVTFHNIIDVLQFH